MLNDIKNRLDKLASELESSSELKHLAGLLDTVHNTLDGAKDVVVDAVQDLWKEFSMGAKDISAINSKIAVWLNTHMGDNVVAKAYGIAAGDAKFQTSDQRLIQDQKDFLLKYRRGELSSKIAQLNNQIRLARRDGKAIQDEKILVSVRFYESLADMIDEWLKGK